MKGPLLVKLGGVAVDRRDELEALWNALATLHARSETRCVLLHGGGKAVDRQLERLGLTSDRREGIRITPPEHLEEIVGVLAGRVNLALVGRLQRAGAPAVGLSLGDGFLTRSVVTRRFAFDPGRVGEIEGGDPRLIRTLLREGFLPVLSSIAIDASGLPLNINADDAASDLAVLLGASALLLLTDVRAVLDGEGHAIPRLDEPSIEHLIARGVVHGGMIPKVRGALEFAKQTGIDVRIASWQHPEDLLSILAGDDAGTCGTLITARA